MAKNWDTVQVRSEVKEELKTIYNSDNKRPDNQKFNAWFDNLLQKYVEFNEELRQYGPFLEFKDAIDNMISIFDHRINKSVDVYINGKKKELRCEFDNRNDCLHVGFCFAIPEVYKVLIDNGFKEPKLKK